VKTPVVVKGVMTVGEAKAAVERGMCGVVVSSHGRAVRSGPAAIEVLPSISDPVGGRAVVMIDGSFRRGSDVLKALILGVRSGKKRPRCA
jgi:isopentenyl diphosphate isomerase/L-lactate dehydrogenase-like FMN-dependent dehydrogenase